MILPAADALIVQLEIPLETVAAAAAACMTPATDLCRAEDVARLMATVQPVVLT